MRNRINLFSIATAILMVNGIQMAYAQALPDAPRPQTGGEWGQVGTPVSEMVGTNGVQPFMDALSFDSKLTFTLIDEDIVTRIKANSPYTFSSVAIPDDLKVDTTEYSGKALTLEDLNKLADEAHSQCLNHGHVCQVVLTKEADTTTAYKLVVALKPLKINAVNINGNRYFRKSVIKYLLGVKPQKELNVAKLQKNLRLLQDNPDLSIETSLEPVELTDTVNVNLKVNEHLPIHVSSFWNNIDQSYYGQQMTGTNVTINNVTGLNDTLSATAITDAKVHGIFTHYEVPINSHGTRFGLDYSFLKATPIGKDYTPYKIRGDIWSISPSIIQVLVAKENLRLSTDLNMDFRQVRTTAFRNTTIEREQIRDIRWGVNLANNGEHYELATRQEVTVGLPILGGSPNSSPDLSNTGGGSQFLKYIGTYYLSHELPWSMAAVLNGTVQWSPWTLPGTDVGGLGGTYAGRGYTEGILSADSLIFTSGELHFPAFMIPKSWKIPKTDINIRESVRFLTFVDYGAGFVNDKNIDPNQSKQILSTGVGARVEFSKYLSGRCDLGIPLIRHTGGVPHHARIHFGLQANVL